MRGPFLLPRSAIRRGILHAGSCGVPRFVGKRIALPRGRLGTLFFPRGWSTVGGVFLFRLLLIYPMVFLV